MNWDHILGRCREVADQAKARWEKLSDGEWRVVREKRDRLVAMMTQKSDVPTNEAKPHVKHFEDMH
jgi:hypothetical protein